MVPTKTTNKMHLVNQWFVSELIFDNTFLYKDIKTIILITNLILRAVFTRREHNVIKTVPGFNVSLHFCLFQEAFIAVITPAMDMSPKYLRCAVTP